MAGLTLLPVALLTLVPVDRNLAIGCEVAWTLPTFGRVELAANVVLFVAPVLFVAVATRRWLLALAVGTALSAAIETLQAIAPVLGRSCSTNDWLSNSIGAVIGAVLGWLALRNANWRSGQRNGASMQRFCENRFQVRPGSAGRRH